MAVRENQGLQIALIIFVLLTIMLSVTTFLFFRNYQYEQQRAKDEEKKASDATKEKLDLQADRDKFVQYIGGYAPTEKEPTISENWKNDVASAQALGIGNLPDDQKNYRKLVDGLQAVIRAKNSLLAKQDADLKEARDTLATKTAQFTADKDKLEKDKAQAVADYLAAREQISKQLTDVRTTETDLTAKNAAKDKELETTKSQSQAKIGDLEKTLAKSETHVKQIKEQLQEVQSEFNVNALPSGKVSWVNQRENLVYINLGTDDHLHKRITFSVYAPGTTDVSALNPVSPNVSKAVSKASIEVINVTNPHLAECRILKDSSSNPIVPGDLIFTPVWRPGQQDHFALVGVMDVNGDGSDDRQRVRDVIALNGGIVDAEVGPDGKQIGHVGLNTRYVVVGDMSSPSRAGEGSTKLLEEAKKFNVETITLSKLLDMMGYTPKTEGKYIPADQVLHPMNLGTPTDGFHPRSPPSPSQPTSGG